MGQHTVVLIPGDGIGPEVVEAAQKVIEATGVEIEWKTFEAGAKALERYGTPLPEAILEGIRRSRVALKGPVTTPIGTGFSSITVALRKKLGLYANLRPMKSIPGVPGRYQNVDLVIIRENTEGLYSGIERRVNDDTAEAVKRVTRRASLRIARFAFDYARRHRRKMVAAVHKANILKLSDGLFLECAREVAADYPEIEYRERIVDALCMDLVLDPGRHDVLLCPNLYGDIVSDLAAGLVGGLGLVPAVNIGDGMAVFEAVHGSAPDIAGQGIANPTALILAGAMMLSYLGEEEAAKRIEEGIRGVYAQGKHLTPDVGGTASTGEMADAVLSHVCS
ncbi:MAG: isocitrate/isopropylmalate dehydrogenase family protein [Dehalococcoidia bacterium]